MIKLPRLYAIVDAGCFARAADPPAQVAQHVRELIAAGVTLIQYRNKNGSAREILEQVRELLRVLDVALPPSARAAQASVPHNPAQAGAPVPHETAQAGAPVPHNRARLIMNDRADLCLAAECAGVHVGQDDLSPQAVRAIVGPERWVGVSTHNPGQVREADAWPVDYVAVGPVFATGSKLNPDPVIGLEGVRAARALTSKPLVAIGGITRENCRQVIAAGADSVAVISDLLREPRRAAKEFRRAME